MAKKDRRDYCTDFQVFGTTTVGERGQVVIPADARKHFNINKGDNFLVISGGPHQEVIGLVPLQAMGDFAKKFRTFADRIEKQIKKVHE